MPKLLSYRNQSTDLLWKSIDWFLHEGKTGIRWVNVNKAQGHDDIYIRLLKICYAELLKPLSLTLKNYIQYGIFLNLGKKIKHCRNLLKKVGKQRMVNYCLFSLLPIRGKVKDKSKLQRYFKSLLLHLILITAI